MINSSRNNEQVAFFDQNANPFVVFVSHIKIAAAFKTASRFGIAVNVFFKKHFHLFLIFWKVFWRNGYFVLEVVILLFYDFLQGSAFFLVFGVEFEELASKRLKILLNRKIFQRKKTFNNFKRDIFKLTRFSRVANFLIEKPGFYHFNWLFSQGDSERKHVLRRARK